MKTIIMLVLCLLGCAPLSADSVTTTWSGTGFPVNIADGGTPTPSYGTLNDLSTPSLNIPRPITSIEFTITLNHANAGDVGIALVSPGAVATHTIIERVGAIGATDAGSDSTYSGTYTFRDSASGNFWTTAAGTATGTPIAPGAYRTSTPGGQTGAGTVTSMDAVFTGLNTTQASGIWTIAVGDCAAGNTGQIVSAVLRINFESKSDGGGGEDDGGCSTGGSSGLTFLSLLAAVSVLTLIFRQRTA